MIVSLLAILSFLPPRPDPNAFDVRKNVLHMVPTTVEGRYSTLQAPESDDARDEREAVEEREVVPDAQTHVDDRVRLPIVVTFGAHTITTVTVDVDGTPVRLSRASPCISQLATEEATRACLEDLRDCRAGAAEAEGLMCAPHSVSFAFIAASPITRRAVETSHTDGVVYRAPMVKDAFGAYRVPGEACTPAVDVAVELATDVATEVPRLIRHPVLSVRVGPIDRERGEVLAAKTEVHGYEAPYLGYGRDEVHYRHYRQLCVYTTCLTPGSVAWRLLAVSAWWWRDRHVFSTGGTTHPVCVSSETLQGPVHFPAALFGDGQLVRAVRVRSPFFSHPHLVSDAVVDVTALAHTHGAYLTELDLYGASLSEGIVLALASGAFTALMYVNATRTTFSDDAWRAAIRARAQAGMPPTCALPRLEELVLDGCHLLRRLDGEFFAHTPNLCKLNVSNCAKLKVIADLAVCCPYITQLCACFTYLEKLDFGTMTNTTGADQPAHAWYLRMVNLDSSGFASLGWVSQAPSLQKLWFSGFDCLDGGVSLKELVSANCLTKLTLFCAQIEDLAPLGECAFLEDLELAYITRASELPYAQDLEPLFLAGANGDDRHPVQRLKRLVVRFGGTVRLDYRSDVDNPLLDHSEEAVEAARFKSMLAQPLHALEELSLENCDDFDDLHTLLTLPTGNDMAELEKTDKSNRTFVARFPNLKVLDIGGTHITELESIVRYCPALTSLSVLSCRHLNVPRACDALWALIREAGLEDEESAKAVHGRDHIASVESDGPPATHRATGRNSQLLRLRDLNCNFRVGLYSDAFDEGILTLLYKALSIMCPALEVLETRDPFTVFEKRKDWQRLPVFPSVTRLSGTLMTASAKRARNGGLRSAMAHMFPRLAYADVSLAGLSGSAPATSPFECILSMPHLHTIRSPTTPFPHTESLVTELMCPLKHLVCAEPDEPLMRALQQAPRLETLAVSVTWARSNKTVLLDLTRRNPSLWIDVTEA